MLKSQLHAMGRSLAGCCGVSYLMEGRKAELCCFPQVPIGIDADYVLAKGPAASNVDNVNAVLGGYGGTSGTLVSLLPP